MRTRLTGLILAGGQGRRMQGQDKGLIEIHTRLMVEWLSEALSPQVDEVIIVANRNLDEYARLGHKVISDAQTDFQGPLAGLEAGLRAANFDQLISVPVDSPFIPHFYAERMISQSQGRAAVATIDGVVQPVFALLPRSTLSSLRQFLSNGERQAKRWLAGLGAVEVDFSDCAESFSDADTPDDLAALAERRPRADR